MVDAVTWFLNALDDGIELFTNTPGFLTGEADIGDQNLQNSGDPLVPGGVHLDDYPNSTTPNVPATPPGGNQPTGETPGPGELPVTDSYGNSRFSLTTVKGWLRIYGAGVDIRIDLSRPLVAKNLLGKEVKYFITRKRNGRRRPSRDQRQDARISSLQRQLNNVERRR